MSKMEGLIAEMAALPDALDRAMYKKKYAEVGFIAHGWMRRCVRGSLALIELERAGYGGETPPLCRSVIEHAVALKWLVADGAEILGPLKTDHASGAQRLVSAWEKSTKSKWDEEDFARLLASLEHDDHSRDFLQQFAHRVAHFGTPDDLTAYQAETLRSHATYQSATDYWDLENSRPVQMVIEDGNMRKFAAAHMYMSLNSYNQIFIAPPWTSTLSRIRAALITSYRDLKRAI